MHLLIPYFIIPLCLWLLFPVSVHKEEKISLSKGLKNQYARIPARTITVDGSEKRGTSFYLSKTEVSNAEYQAFLRDLWDTQQKEDFIFSQIDSTVWLIDSTNQNNLSVYYHNHPAYENYPVVGISLDAAQRYCQWRTQQLNKNANEKYQYQVQLPTRDEFLQAAIPLKGDAPYSFGPTLRNDRGDYQCNFLCIQNKDVTTSTTGEYQVVQQSSDINLFNPEKTIFSTTPVQSYDANDFGVFNLNGNVAELTRDNRVCGGSWEDVAYDVRNESHYSYTGPSRSIGFRTVLMVTLKNTAS